MKDTAGRSVAVAVGVVSNGVGTLVMLAVASRLFSVADFAVFSTWWIVATLVTFPLGVFEALLTRQVVADVVADRASGSGTGAVAARAALLVIPVVLALGLAAPALGNALFGGVSALSAVLAAFLLSSLVQALERGHAAGSDRFGAVAVLLTLDGALRAGALLLCAPLGVDTPSAAALAVLGASALTALAGHIGLRGWVGRAAGRRPSFTRTTAMLLLAGSVGPMLINNASVPWLSGHDAAAALVGSFSGALALSRVPTQLGGAAFGPLLRRFSHAIEVGDETLERAEFRTAILFAAGMSVIFVIGFTVLANPVLSVFLGSTYHVPVWVCALLALSSGAMLVAVVAQVRVAARQQWRLIAASWLLAAAAFMIVLIGPGSLLARCALAPALASFVGLVALLMSGRSAALRPQPSAVR